MLRVPAVGLLVGGMVSVAASVPDHSSLIDAIRNQDLRAASELIDSHIDVNAELFDGSTALAWAAYEDQPEIVERLIKAGAKANTADDYGETPLTLACANGNASIVEKLLRAEADVKAARWNGETALMIAARSGNPRIVQMLIDRGANVNAMESRKGQNALMWAASEGHAEVVHILLKAGADVNIASKGGFTPLIFAATAGDTASVADLVNAGAQIDHAVPAGMNALLIATATGKFELASLLVEKGANVSVKDRNGYTALHMASQLGNMNLVSRLIAKGAEVNGKTSKSQAGGRGGGGFRAPLGEQTALLLAARANHPEVMHALVDSGADPKLTAQDGTTLLMAAAASGHLEPVQYAYELSPDIKAVNQAKQTVVHAAVLGTARISTQPEISRVLEFLAAKGADLKAADSTGKTPLSIATGASMDIVVKTIANLIHDSDGSQPPSGPRQ